MYKKKKIKSSQMIEIQIGIYDDVEVKVLEKAYRKHKREQYIKSKGGSHELLVSDTNDSKKIEAPNRGRKRHVL